MNALTYTLNLRPPQVTYCFGLEFVVHRVSCVNMFFSIHGGRSDKLNHLVKMHYFWIHVSLPNDM